MYQVLMEKIVNQGASTDAWAGHALNGLRNKLFLSDVDLFAKVNIDRDHPVSTGQPLPDLTTIRQLMGSALAYTFDGEGWVPTLACNPESVEQRAALIYNPAKTVHRLLEVLTEDTARDDLVYGAPRWGHLLRAPLLTLTSPDHTEYIGHNLEQAFVVDLDHDTVALIERLHTENGDGRWDGRWEVESCARLSDRRQLSDMRTDLYAKQQDNPAPLWQQLPSLQQRSNLRRFNKLGGPALRSFLYSPCAANLGRPSGFPLLVNEDLYPVDDKPDLLEDRYRQKADTLPAPVFGDPLPETELEQLTRVAFETQRLDTFSTEELIQAARSHKPRYTAYGYGDTELTPKLYNLIIKLKKTRDFTNFRIGDLLGVPESLVQTLTKGMPRVKPKSARRDNMVASGRWSGS